MIKTLKPSLATHGFIKTGGIGKEVTSGSGKKFKPPVKFSSFRLTYNERDGNDELVTNEPIMEALREHNGVAKGGKVTRLPIVLHSDDIDAVFPTSYCCYKGKKLECRSDGVSAEQRNPSGGDPLKFACVRTPNDEGKFMCPKVKGECKANGTLHCSLALPGHAVAGAVYKWRTGSIISVKQMVGSLQQIQQTVGVLRGVPLRLVVRPVVCTPTVNGKTITTTVYCCHLELHAPDIKSVRQDAIADRQDRLALANGVDLDAQYKQLVAPPGFNETPEEQAEVADEYYTQEQPKQLPPSNRQSAVTSKLSAKLDTLHAKA